MTLLSVWFLYSSTKEKEEDIDVTVSLLFAVGKTIGQSFVGRYDVHEQLCHCMGSYVHRKSMRLGWVAPAALVTWSGALGA